MLDNIEKLDQQFSSFMGTPSDMHMIDEIIADTGASYSDVMRVLIRLGAAEYEREKSK